MHALFSFCVPDIDLNSGELNVNLMIAVASVVELMVKFTRARWLVEQ